MKSTIHDHQQAYYDAINTANNTGESTVFVKFMLAVIIASLTETVSVSDELSDGTMDKAELRRKTRKDYLQNRNYIMNTDVCEMCGVSAATKSRTLAGFVADERREKCHANGHWEYSTSKEMAVCVFF